MSYFQEEPSGFDTKKDYMDELKEDQSSNKAREPTEDAWKKARLCSRAAQLCFNGREGARSAHSTRTTVHRLVLGYMATCASWHSRALQ